jgi:hypothetical protein
VLLATAAACSKSATPTSVSSSTPPPSPDANADRASAQGVILVQADFPAGWKGTPHQKDPNEDAQSKAMAACVGAPDPTTTQEVDVQGDDFDMGNASASSDVTFVKTLQDAQADLAALAGPKLGPCVKTFARNLLEGDLAQQAPGAKITAFDFATRAVPSFGDATHAFRITATASISGQTIKFFIDLVFMLRGRAEAEVDLFNIGAPFDEALGSSLIQKFGARVAALPAT